MYNKTSLFGKLIVGAFTGMLLFTGVQTAHVYANNNDDYHSDDGACYSSSHLFYKGTTKYMKNWVKESNKNFATIKATLCDYEATSYSGYWSPDNMSGY